jgi:Ca2+-binding RTX toxin-like protein
MDFLSNLNKMREKMDLINYTGHYIYKGSDSGDSVRFDNQTEYGQQTSLYVIDTKGDDTFIINDSYNATVKAGEGNDRLHVTYTHDSTFLGFSGDDFITAYGTDSTTLINGGEGNDTVRLLDGASASILGGSGNDDISRTDIVSFGTVTGGNGDDFIYELNHYGSFDVVKGGAGNDTIIGSESERFLNDYFLLNGYVPLGGQELSGGYGNDVIYGTFGNAYKSPSTLDGDTIRGDSGNDSLTGSNQRDVLFGGTGNDTLVGGAGADIMTGGEGADRFVFKTLEDTRVKTEYRDRINDFRHTEGDKIDLSKLDIDSFIMTDAFTGEQSAIRYFHQLRIDGEMNTVIQISTDLDAEVEMEIQFSKQLLDFSFSDFVL